MCAQEVAPHAPQYLWQTTLGKVNATIATLIELPAAILVVVEIAVLLCGVVSRYLLNNPLIWTDELAGIVFLWIGMLGSAIAVRRAEHMRLTIVLDHMPPKARAWTETFATLLSLAFLAGMLPPALEYLEQESGIVMPGLEISAGARVLALVTGISLMGLGCVMRLLANARLADVLSGSAVILVLAGGLYLVGPALASLGHVNLAIYFGVIIGLCLVLGVPIGFAFGVGTAVYLVLGTSAPLGVFIGRMDEGMTHMILLSIPLFIVLGALMEMAGLARAMILFLASLLGHVRGGLNYVLIGSMYLVSGISGSKAADMAAVAPVLYPEMRKRGQSSGEIVALLATSGAMAETIPPSLALITIGSVTGVSIASLFTGGLLPAVVVGAVLAVLVFFRTRNDRSVESTKAPIREVVRTLVFALPALALPALIRLVVAKGVASATEVSAIAIAYTIAVGVVIYRNFEWRRLFGALVSTACLSGAILFIIGTATAMAWALTQSGFSGDLAALMSTVPNQAAFLAISIVAFIVLGSVLEGIPALLVFGPLLFPIARTFGVHEVQYAMVAILAMGVGMFAPPFGVGYYIACAVTGAQPTVAVKAIWPYLAAVLVGLILVAAIPWVSVGFL